MKELTLENILAVLKEQGWIVTQLNHVTTNYEACKSLKCKPCGYSVIVMEPEMLKEEEKK